MKSGLVIVFIILSMLAVGCSTNTRQQNTGIGVVTGGVVGGVAGGLIGSSPLAVVGGAVVGAVVGGLIGNSMDSTDNSAMNSALNNNAKNQTSTWTNQKTGARYSFTPTSKMMMVNGNPYCRKFRAKAVINGKVQKVHGVACKQTDGTWKAVNGRM